MPSVPGTGSVSTQAFLSLQRQMAENTGPTASQNSGTSSAGTDVLSGAVATNTSGYAGVSQAVTTYLLNQEEVSSASAAPTSTRATTSASSTSTGTDSISLEKTSGDAARAPATGGGGSSSGSSTKTVTVTEANGSVVQLTEDDRGVVISEKVIKAASQN